VDRVDVLITDDKAPAAALEALEDAGVTTVIA
jgi:DeoR/GlpR family transcriptional regulator of sugar metabolism